jgi:hypothetical protein
MHGPLNVKCSCVLCLGANCVLILALYLLRTVHTFNCKLLWTEHATCGDQWELIRKVWFGKKLCSFPPGSAPRQGTGPRCQYQSCSRQSTTVLRYVQRITQFAALSAIRTGICSAQWQYSLTLLVSYCDTVLLLQVRLPSVLHVIWIG